MTAIDEFIENNNPKEKQKQTKLKQLKKMGELYLQLAEQIYTLEDSMDTQPKEPNNITVEKDKEVIAEETEKPTRKFTEKEQLMMDIANISGQIKKLKRDIDFEIYEPAIAKINKRLDELKAHKLKFSKRLEILKKK